MDTAECRSEIPVSLKLGAAEVWRRSVGEIVWEIGGEGVGGERNILDIIIRGKANWICHILCKKCFLRHVIEGKIKGKIEVTGRRGGRRK
jgi:hypothetical protein